MEIRTWRQQTQFAVTDGLYIGMPHLYSEMSQMNCCLASKYYVEQGQLSRCQHQATIELTQESRYYSRQEIFPFSTSSTQFMGLTQPPFHWVPGILFPEAKPEDRENDHSPASIAEVKNVRRHSYTATPLCLHGVVFSSVQG